MNIAFFTDTYLPTVNGVVTSIEIFRQTLEKKGHTVYIFAPHGPKNKKKEIKNEKNVFRFKSTKYIWYPDCRLSFPYSRILNRFSKLNINIIHSHTSFSVGLLAMYMSKKYSVPLLVTYHTLFIEYNHHMLMPKEYFKKFVKWSSKSYCNACDLVISPTEIIKRELENYNVSTDIKVIPTGIDLTDYHKIHTEEIIIKYDLDIDREYLITISRLDKEKNIPFLLEAFAEIHKEKPNIRFIIIGDGSNKKKLSKQAEELQILDKIIFTGYIDRKQIFPLLKFSKLFIFASKTETQGLVLLEAMSMKIPVVAVDAMGVSNVLENNAGGILSEEDVQVFVSYVLNLLDDGNLYKEKSQEAYQRALSLSANKMTKRLINSYSLLLNQPNGN